MQRLETLCADRFVWFPISVNPSRFYNLYIYVVYTNRQARGLHVDAFFIGYVLGNSTHIHQWHFTGIGVIMLLH